MLVEDIPGSSRFLRESIFSARLLNRHAILRDPILAIVRVALILIFFFFFFYGF
jgi:hypothetical protein